MFYRGLFAVQANAKVKLAVVPVPSPHAPATDPVPAPVPVWMDLAGADPAALDPDDFYLARAGWWPDGSVMAQVQNRRQTVLQVLRLDPSTGAREVRLSLILSQDSVDLTCSVACQ